MVRRLYVGARMRELKLNRVAPELRRLALLFAADRQHLFISEFEKCPRARRTGAIGRDHPAKGLARQVETIGDARMRHDLDVVLMRRDAQVRHPRKRGGGQLVAFGQKNVGIGAE